MAVGEFLLQVSSVLLFGKELSDLKLEKTGPTPPDQLNRKGANQFLQKQFDAGGARLARIYAFSYEGGFYELPCPAIFLVHGEGFDPEYPPPGDDRYSRAPSVSEQTGLASQVGSFARDIRVWAYDKSDLTIRLDVATGTIDEVLLALEVETSGGLARSSGARSSGARSSGARSSGALARSSGVMLRRMVDGD